MRDINRIVTLLNELGETWKKCPDMRFGQLVSNLVPKDGLSDEAWIRCLWNWEEDNWMEAIKDFGDKI